jgi:hypothetical protein
VEINAELFLIATDDSMMLCDCFWGGRCEGEIVSERDDFDDLPPIPRVTLFDAYKAKRK